MLFWLFVIMVAVGIVCCILAEHTWTWDDLLEALGSFFITVGGIGILASLFFIVGNHCGLQGYIQENEARYDSLIYQYENNLYDNDNDVGKKELMKEIQEWNEDLANYKANQKDFWLGIFIPNIYDQFEFIELK